MEIFNRISDGERPALRADLSKEAADVLKKCWDMNAAMRPTIHKVLELFNNTEFAYLDHKNTVEGNRTSFQKLNVSNENEDDTFSKTITAFNDGDPPLIPPGVTSERPPFPTSIQKSPGGWNGSKKTDSLLLLQNNGEDDENWKELNIKLPYAVEGHGAQFLNNYLYIFGGQNENKEVFNSTYKLTKDLQWKKMATMNEDRTEISNSSVILNDRIWVMGGWEGKSLLKLVNILMNFSSVGTLKSVEMYDPKTNIWTSIKEMNEYRSLAATAVVNGKIFCCGGWNGRNCLKSAECYDPFSNVWTLIADMPGPNAGCGIMVMDVHLIVIGGKANRDKDYLNSVWVLDTDYKHEEWIETSCMSFGRCQFGIAKIDDKAFVCGGLYFDQKDSTGYFSNDVEIFDGQVWSNGPKMFTYHVSHAAIVIPTEFARSLI